MRWISWSRYRSTRPGSFSIASRPERPSPLQLVSLNPKPVPGDLALESAKGVQLPDEVVDSFAKDLEMMANDVSVWVVAFRAVHQAILGNRRSPIAT